MIVVFRKVNSKNIYNEPICSDLSWIFNTGCYFKILNMKKQKPISYDAAANMCLKHCRDLTDEKKFKMSAQFFQKGDWIKFISDQGFHIELTGDEFEIIHEKQTVNQ